MTWRIAMQCPHGFTLQVPIERIVVVERTINDELVRGIEVDRIPCASHARESKQLLTKEERHEPSARDRRRLKREIRKLERTLKQPRSKRFR